MTRSERLTTATFKKCDLHVHSSSCYSRSYDKKGFLDTIAASDLDALAITDHNSIDVDLLTEADSLLKSEDKVLLAGVEINVRLKDETIKANNLVLGDGRRGEYFHAIVLTSMEHVAALAGVIDGLFMPLAIEGCSDTLSEQELGALPRKAYSKYTEGKAAYLEDFQDKARHIPHFFIPHENKDRSLSQYLPNGSRENPIVSNLEYKDKLFYYSQAMAVEGGEKSRRGISTGIAEELHTTVAALFFSDAKKLEEIGSKYTWIDFDGGLDSLLLAISDPESRIKTSDKHPTLPQTNTASFLEKVAFCTVIDGDPAKTAPQSITFTPGYNGIVGSRGSGKTMLASVLAGQGLDTYASYVDMDSVRYTMHGGIPTANRPACLYLNQGALESIFSTGEYEQIPFLGNRVAPMKESADRTSREALKRLRDLLKLEKEVLEAFCSKYQHGSLRIDHLDTEVPSGVTIDIPSAPASDRQQLSQGITKLEEMSKPLSDAANVASTLHFTSGFPENKTLFESLEAEANGIRADLESLRERVCRVSKALSEYDDPWLSSREGLLAVFTSIARDMNNESGSTKLSQFKEEARASADFLDDLLALRRAVAYLDKEAEAAFAKMRTPIEPDRQTIDDEEIIIGLGPEEESTYSSLCDEQTANQYPLGTQPLVRALLYRFDQQLMHKFFNGRKYSSCSQQNLSSHLSKYFANVNSSIEGARALKTSITVGGKDIANMSPGMKAQALLKLFLNDGIAAGQWVYVVLDQPEDNLDVATIKDFLVDRLKKLKLNVQFFVVSHSAPVIVNGDARTVVVCENDDASISYTFGSLNDQKVKQSIADVLDGGERYLKMRLNKYNFQVGDKR